MDTAAFTAAIIAAVPCPTCLVPVGQPCTRPTGTTRLTSKYVHLSRQDAYHEQAGA